MTRRIFCEDSGNGTNLCGDGLGWGRIRIPCSSLAITRRNIAKIVFSSDPVTGCRNALFLRNSGIFNINVDCHVCETKHKNWTHIIECRLTLRRETIRFCPKLWTSALPAQYFHLNVYWFIICNCSWGICKHDIDNRLIIVLFLTGILLPAVLLGRFCRWLLFVNTVDIPYWWCYHVMVIVERQINFILRLVKTQSNTFRSRTVWT